MLSIQSNLLAMNANRQFQINDKKNRKTTEKLSSGYRINRASDDAAGLSVSEKMRRQLRGLKQGTANAQEGISFVQVADGSMDEVHSMLQRMNELALKSLNGTCTESDRAALNAEFDQLCTEIDRISSATEFNEQPVFEEHEDSYYQIAGNRRWNDNQKHTVPSLANELNIYLPENYDPNEYTLTVPAGVYTTQELIDEIDDAMGRMEPFNPGFVFEYTDKGFCNLNFESADGMPTEIASVDGSLSYLLYDSYGGSSTISLLGTTVFDSRYPLPIVSGINDEIGFYVESVRGTDYISMKIPAGSYTRPQMIDLINNNLANNPDAAGVAAMEYGDSSIQISGGEGVSITGLKGNMFKYESTTPSYTSVFYDNVQYGASTGGTKAYITGGSFYDSRTAKIDISAANNNNVLKFKVNDTTGYKEITISDKEYTMSELAKEINDRLKDEGLDTEVQASVYSSSNRLRLESTKRGSSSLLEFDTTANTVYGNTYDALFINTNYLPEKSADAKKASIEGLTMFTGKVNLAADASLSFNVDNDGRTYTITGIGGEYDSLGKLAEKINTYISDNYPDIKDIIKFSAPGGRLRIEAGTNDVQKIYFSDANRNNTYKQLFQGTGTSVNSGSFSSSYGSVSKPQGSTVVNTTDATASAVVPEAQRNKTIEIKKNDNDTVGFSINGYSRSITLDAGTYTMNTLAAAINAKLQSSGDQYLKTVKASYDSSAGKLNFTSTPPASASAGSWSLSISSNGYGRGSVWKSIYGTTTSITNPTPVKASQTTLTTYLVIPETTTLDSNNNQLTLNIGKGDVTVNIAPGTYNTREKLREALQAAIDSSSLNGSVTAEITSDNKLRLATSGSLTGYSGSSFYKNVLTTTSAAAKPYNYVKEGEYADSSYTKAFIIGRKDLTKEPVEIVSGANDAFTFDFSFKSADNASADYEKQIDVTIPEGVYDGSELTRILQEKIRDKFAEEGLDDFEVNVSVGGVNTHVIGSNDDTSLQIAVNRKAGKTPAAGTYVLDGIRGSTASFVFYKTTDKPKETYITGTKNISDGITFIPGQNVLTLSADAVPYKYTFPENVKYTADEFVGLLNGMFANGDDNGNIAPLNASIENGALKIAHKVVGTHTITDVGGSARSTLFLAEGGRNFRDPVILLVGAETKDVVEIPRTRVNSCSLAINSITISRPKYADKAVNRIKEAITSLSSRRSAYGSMQNRLEHTINNNNNVIENTQASESAIRDADIAHEVMEQAVNNFLLQASQTVLTQANQQANMVLQLLQ